MEQLADKDRRAYNDVGYLLTLSDGFDAVGGGGEPSASYSSPQQHTPVPDIADHSVVSTDTSY